MKLTPPIPENCQWAMFLRNHDELTLEMVTDEERDYMYRTYANFREMRINLGIRRRLAPLLENDRRKIELMNGLLFSLPGTPVLYYGDEIGMGDNVFLGDRNGVRTPMQWSADRNAGFSRANPQRLYLPVNIDPEYHYENVNVEAQQNNPHSLLWWMKRLIAQRKQFRAFGRGSLEFLYPNNRKILAFLRKFEDEQVLVVANLSRFTQCCELDLSRYVGSMPVEIFGRSRFPAITENPYFLSLGPHAFYWFHLQPREASQESLSASPSAQQLPIVPVESAEVIFSEMTLRAISRILPRVLRQRSWFLGKNHSIMNIRFQDVISFPGTSAHILLSEVEYADSDPELYLLALSVALGERAEAVLHEHPDVVLARLEGLGPDTTGILYGSSVDRDFSDALLRAIVRRRRVKGSYGDLLGSHTPAFRKAWTHLHSNLEPSPEITGQNTVIDFGDDFALKLYRKLEEGTHPGREVQEFLTEHTQFTATPRALGSLEYRRVIDEDIHLTTLGTMTGFVANATSGWTYTLDHLSLFFEHALAIQPADPRLKQLASINAASSADEDVPPVIADLLGNYAESVRLLASRTAEMHTALSSRPDIPDFAPEPFTEFYRHSIYHGMLGRLNRCFEILRSRLYSLPVSAQAECTEVLGLEAEIRSRFLVLRDRRITCTRIRHHSDYHLSNVLFVGNDWVITNFEGTPERALSERRIKRSALRDVATMLRSFHYVAHAALFGDVPGIVPSKEGHPQLEHWAQIWYRSVSSIFLRQYVKAAAGNGYLPQGDQEFRILVSSYLLERALLEVLHELEFRPAWVRIPIHGIVEHLKPLAVSA